MYEYLVGLSAVVIMFLIIFYFLPTIIALFRGKSNIFAIFLVNLFFGWSFIGWIVSLVWAVSSDADNKTIIINNSVSPERTNNNFVNPNYQNDNLQFVNNRSINEAYRDKVFLKENNQDILNQSDKINHQDKITQLKEIKELLDNGIFTQEEFEQEKRKILAK